jgi:mannosyltransferase OCH1-like enzyme
MRVIHRLWMGPVAMPDKYVRYGDRWRELNPDWILHDWTKDTLPPLMNQDVFDFIGEPQGDEHLHPISVATQQADVAGYELVYRYGGLYVNCDIEPVRPLSNLLPLVGECAYAGYEDDNFIVNAAIGGPAGHMFWLAVLQELPNRFWANPRGPMNEVTGPHLLTAVYNMGWPDFVALPREVFNPIHFHEVPLGGDAEGTFHVDALPEITIGVHHWGHRLTGRPNRVDEG